MSKSHRSWQEIAAQAAKERDAEKLRVVTAELVRTLEEQYKPLRVPGEQPAKPQA